MKYLISFATLLCLSTPSLSPAFAQDAEGNDTPGDWVVTHYKPFGLWDSVCDQAERDGEKVDRCYIRYVEVFSPQPKFAAQFVFITPDDDGYEVELGIEKGTLFKGSGDEAGFKIIDYDRITWAYDPNKCLIRGECVLKGAQAREFVEAMATTKGDKAALVSDFVDRHRADQILEWDITQFDAALRDFQQESKKRSLIK